MGPGLILPSPTPAGPGRGPRGPPGGQPRSGAARTAAPAPPGGSAPLAGLPLLPGTGRALPRARGQRAGASRGGAAGTRSCRRLQSARRAGTGTSGAGAGTGVGAGRARSGPALPFPAGRGAVPPKGRAAGGRAARCPPGTVRAPSQLLPSLPSALRQRQESLEKTSEGFSNSSRRDLSQREKKKEEKKKRDSQPQFHLCKLKGIKTPTRCSREVQTKRPRQVLRSASLARALPPLAKWLGQGSGSSWPHGRGQIPLSLMPPGISGARRGPQGK